MTKDIKPMLSEQENEVELLLRYGHLLPGHQHECPPAEYAYEVWWEFIDHRYGRG